VSGWDSLGIRDPRLLVDINGYLVTESGNLIMYYSGYQLASPHYRRAIGRAISSDGIVWSKDESNPILVSGTSGAWDDFGVQFPSPIKISENNYYMAYSGVNSTWTAWGIGIATSVDGLNWSKYDSNPVLDADDFILGGNEVLTFPTVIKAKSGTWYMLIGGTYAGVPDRFKIFAASSLDGFSWSVLNSGNPVIGLSKNELLYDISDNIESGCFLELRESEFVLVYHGNADIGGRKHYVGVAVSNDVINWTQAEGNPILVPGDTGMWDEHRVEMVFIPKEDFGGLVRMWYCGTPSSDGENNSAIGYAISDQRFI
jgi:predicted GH43/DUF377 family glycosyl hydrolase